jgi:hypothetical protein
MTKFEKDYDYEIVLTEAFTNKLDKLIASANNFQQLADEWGVSLNQLPITRKMADGSVKVSTLTYVLELLKEAGKDYELSDEGRLCFYTKYNTLTIVLDKLTKLAAKSQLIFAFDRITKISRCEWKV